MNFPSRMKKMFGLWRNASNRSKWIIRILLFILAYSIPIAVVGIEYQIFIKLQLSTFAPSDEHNIYLIQRIYLNAAWLFGATSLLVWITIKLARIRGKFLSAPWVFMLIFLFCLFLLLLQWFDWSGL